MNQGGHSRVEVLSWYLLRVTEETHQVEVVTQELPSSNMKQDLNHPKARHEKGPYL
jgi:hypothetical protein